MYSTIKCRIQIQSYIVTLADDIQCNKTVCTVDYEKCPFKYVILENIRQCCHMLTNSSKITRDIKMNEGSAAFYCSFQIYFYIGHFEFFVIILLSY